MTIPNPVHPRSMRPGQLAALATLTLCVLASYSATPALASSSGCPNDQVRQASNVNHTTGQPYSVDLPECRSYEMVSPPEKSGANLGLLKEGQRSRLPLTAKLLGSPLRTGSATPKTISLARWG